jgi:Zn-dependent protease
MAWGALAGPWANLLMLILWALIAKSVLYAGLDNTGFGVIIIAMALVGIFINAILMLFNLVPIPPLDGSRVMAAILPPKTAFKYSKLEPYGLIIVIVLMFVFWSDFFRAINVLNTYVNRFLFL